MAWKVIDLFQADFIPLCFSSVSDFTVTRTQSFCESLCCELSGRRGSTQFSYYRDQKTRWSFLNSLVDPFQSQELIWTKETGHSIHMQWWGSYFQLQVHVILSAKVYCAHLPFISYLTVPGMLQPRSLHSPQQILRHGRSGAGVLRQEPAKRHAGLSSAGGLTWLKDGVCK